MKIGWALDIIGWACAQPFPTLATPLSARSSQSPFYWQKYQLLKKEIQKECRKVYTNYVSTLVNDNGHVNKRLWTFIKSQRKDHCGVALLKCNSKVHDDTTTKTDILNNYFTSVFTQDSAAPPPPIQGHPFPDISPIAINCVMGLHSF